MKKFTVHYVRIEHQVFLIDVDAKNAEEAETKAEELFLNGDIDDYDDFEVVHAEEFVNQVDEIKGTK